MKKLLLAAFFAVSLCAQSQVTPPGYAMSENEISQISTMELPSFNQADLISLRTQAGLNDLLPGLTGWAQVNGRNAISWEQKFKLDVDYVEKQSMFLDIKILWMTFIKVINRDGINTANNTIMEEFMGNKGYK